MVSYKASEFDYNQKLSSGVEIRPHPLLRDSFGPYTLYSIGPEHGRSYVIIQQEGRYVVSKGNGLSYSSYSLINTGEMGNETWGLLLMEDAVRDFTIGQEVAALGIKANRMEYVLEIDLPVQIHDRRLRPALLQYDVECPYRISDVAFMPEDLLRNEVTKWKKMNVRGLDEPYLIAANVLVSNLATLHENGILHNAISTHNYTWALELLDFELASSPTLPYSREDEERHKSDLFPREVLHTYQVINYIARVLSENIDYHAIDAIFRDHGFDLLEMQIVL